MFVDTKRIFTIIFLFQIVNASENEAIIQLSIDSIHVVQTSDLRIPNIEENFSAKEEKDLLIALLKSFDHEKSSDDQIDEFSSMKSASAWSSSIRFLPSNFDFQQQPVAMVKRHSITIINDDEDLLELYSISGTNIQFYSSVFSQMILNGRGGNTSIDIYFLPRTIGPINSTFTIKTNRGHFYYHVQGIGIFNPFRIYPILNLVVPLNSAFEQILHLYNPMNFSIEINEVYTSDENLILEMINTKTTKNKISKNSQSNDQWHLKPFELKPIVRLNYVAYKLGLLHAFICIKTSSNDKIVIPIEINVSNRSGLYSYSDMLTFSPDRIVRSISIPIKIPVYVINNRQDPLIISDVRLSNSTKNYLQIQSKKLRIPADLHRMNKIADLTLYPSLIPKEIDEISGSIQIFTNSNDLILQIPFYSRVFHGSVHFVNNETMFFFPPSKKKRSNRCEPIRLLNRFETDLVVMNVTIDRLDFISEYLHIEFPSTFVYLKSKEWTELLCVTVKNISSTFYNMQVNVEIHTNLSSFNLLLHLYNGFLNIGIPNDEQNGGIRSVSKDSTGFFVASVPIDSSRTVRFILINGNPIDISLQQFDVDSNEIFLQFQHFESIDPTNRTKIIPKDIEPDFIIIPAQHQAIFSLTIHGRTPARFHNESILFQTNFQTIQMFFLYTTTEGSLELVTKMPIHLDVFPNRIGSTDILLQNKFNRSTNVTMMNFLQYGTCFTFFWANTSIGELIIEPNKIQKIGTLTFDMIPLCKSFVHPSESMCYCGLNNHPEFAERWDDYVATMNSSGLDENLVMKFRQLWKDWTSLVRKQMIQTNIWLQTDQANISFPITIGFVWPSIFEQMSTTLTRAPIIIDYHITLINMTKSHNVIINNPSSNLVVYSVELVNNRNESRQRFSISTSSKNVRLIDQIYRFELRPDEQIVFVVSYRPIDATKDETFLAVRNNLTIFESIWLRGEGGVGSLTFGDRSAYSSHLPLTLEINEQHASLCSNFQGNPRFQKVIALINNGNLNTIIHEVLFGNQRCSGKGFLVETCTDIEIIPNEQFYLKILYQPDYTLNEIYEVLILKTNIGLFTIPLIVRIHPKVLAACYKMIPRPLWELRTYFLCLCSVIVFIVLILTIAVYDARRLYENYLSRLEWRDRFQLTENKIFDLGDLSTAVQDEQKIRERIDSDKSTKLTKRNIKSVDLSSQEIKSKTNDIVPRRSSASSTKNGGNHLKSMRSSETLNTTNQSNDSHPKSPQIKTRRATLDIGQSKPINTITIPSRTSDIRSATPTNAFSSSAVSDDDAEPFQPARPRRSSTKSKGSSSTNTTVKTSPGISASSSPPIEQINPNKTKSSRNRRQKRKSLQFHQEILFAQLTEQLRAAKLPNATTSSAMSIRSRCSSAPPSEHGGFDDDDDRRKFLMEFSRERLTKHNENDQDEENIIEWDEPNRPDDDFGAYAAQTEEFNDLLLGLMAMKSTEPSTLITTKKNDAIEMEKQMPGPIQRPTKLPCSPTYQQQMTSFPFDSTQSPNTPDVLVQINHILHHQNSLQTPSVPPIGTSANSMGDLPTPTVPWTPFSTGDFEPTWSNMPSSSTNPFAQRQLSRDDGTVWPSALGTATPRPVSLNRTKTDASAALWNDVFPATTSTSVEPTKTTVAATNLKFWPSPDSSSNGSVTSTTQETQQFWNPIDLNPSEPAPPASWWPKTPTDDNETNPLRWNFPR